MRISATLAALLLACPLVSHAIGNGDAFIFPVRAEKPLILDGANYQIRLHDLPGKGTTGFAWSVMRDGYLLKIEVVDGVAPAIVLLPTPHVKGFGILYKAGARQSVLDLVIVSMNGFDNVRPGKISSNLECIYVGEKDTLLAVSENRGQLIIERFLVREATVTTLTTIRVPKSHTQGALKECAAKSYFGKETE